MRGRAGARAVDSKMEEGEKMRGTEERREGEGGYLDIAVVGDDVGVWSEGPKVARGALCYSESEIPIFRLGK